MKTPLSVISALAFCAASFGAVYVGPSGDRMPNGEPCLVYDFGEYASFGEGITTVIPDGPIVLHNDSRIKSWASGCAADNRSPGVAPQWTNLNNAFGPITDAQAYDTTAKVVCLGDRGSLTLTFPNGIGNGDGLDFAVFENGFSRTYLELAWIEVSTDGVTFVRFPNFYLGLDPVYDFDVSSAVYPTDVYNLASKYECGAGHGFDLAELQYAYNYALNTPIDESSFSPEYTVHLLANFPALDLNNIRYVRIIDIYGDGTSLDSSGWPIYDPTGLNPSEPDQSLVSAAPGFDLRGVAVLNEAATPPPTPYQTWAADNGLAGDDALPAATPRHDGITNLEKFAFGLDGSKPASYSDSPYFVQSVEGGSMVLAYPTSVISADTVTVKALMSTDLVNWLETTATQTGTSPDGKYKLYKATVEIPAGGRVFLKLTVSE